VAAADAFLVGEIPVSISAVPSTATITVNGAVVGTGRTELMLAPQTITIDVEAEGFSDYSEELTLRDSMRGPIFMRANLAAVAGVPVAAEAEPCPECEVCAECAECEVTECPEVPELVCADGTEPVAPDRSNFNRRAVGGILAGTGAASLIGGIVLLAVDGDTTCSSGPLSACPDVFETTAGGAALSVVGGLAIGTGIGLIVGDGGSNDRSAAATSSRARVGFAPRRGGAVVSLSGSF
jgi:hypothetical protein